jgi:DNA-binding transcriptional LysR family regulator
MATPPDWVTLRIFLAALDLGSVTRAADRCGIATSAAAKRIQMLEADWRVSLLERGPRGVRPTVAGEVFARYARTLVDFAARLGDDLRAFAAGSLGSVRLHATASALAGHDLAPALAAFAVEQPGIQVMLREDVSLTILRDLLEGRADLGIVTVGGTMPAGLEAQPWREDRLIVVVPAGHPFTDRASVGFAEVLEQPLVGVLEGGALSLLLEEAAQRLGLRPRYRFQVASTDAARRLVAAGHGVTVMPDRVARPYEAALELRGIPLADRWSRRRLRLVARTAGLLALPARLLQDHLLRPEPAAARDGASAKRGR